MQGVARTMGRMPDPKPDLPEPDSPADEQGDPKPTALPEQKIPGKPISDMAPPGQDEPEDPD